MFVKLFCGIMLAYATLVIRSITAYIITGFVADLIPQVTKDVRIGMVVMILAVIGLMSTNKGKSYKFYSPTFIEDVVQGYCNSIGCCFSVIVYSYLIKTLFLYFVG